VGGHRPPHASALGITAFAYAYARRHAADRRYSFGTWKVGVLGGFTSAVVLGVIAALIAWESVGRLRQPLAIDFNEATLVAVVGLAVNLLSAYMLSGHDLSPEQGASPAGVSGVTRAQRSAGHHHHDHNLRAAYLHVLADALTSFCAIFALLTGKYFGWVWMDPVMGVVGAIIIARWSLGLLRDTSRVLLDGDVEPSLAEQVKLAIEEVADNRVTDLHLWRVGPQSLSAIVAVVTHDPQPPDYYKQLLSRCVRVGHLTVEVNACPAGEACIPER
jgi:cation diffusion facilitator family transporter